ncbi:hypothetical protein [Myroides sp. LJL119]
MYSKNPFSSWLPKPMVLVLILLILFPLMTISGVYISTATNTSGALAVYNEFVTLGNNASTIGMGLSLLIVFRIKMRFKSKQIITFCCIVLALLSLMIANTDNPYLMVTGSLLIGFIKMFPMFEVMMPLMLILTPTGDRGRFYAIFYPISIITSQITGYWFAQVVSNSNYQAPYYIMAICMLLIAVISLLFQHNNRFCFKLPLYQIDWLSMLFLCAYAMSLNTGLTFLKQQAWFGSIYIISWFILSFIFFVLLIYRQHFLKRKLIDFSIFTKSINVKHGFILFLFMGLNMGSASILSQYTSLVLQYNNLINASLNLWMIPGLITAGVLAFLGFKNKWNIKYFIMAGFTSFFLHNLALYFCIQPQINIQYLQYIMILKGIAMGILFIGIWFYTYVGVPMQKLFGIMSILIMIRSCFAAALGSGVITWATYFGQWQSLNDMAMYVDVNALAQNPNLYQTISLNALMASCKIALGALCWMIVPVSILVSTHHYGHFNPRRIILFRKVVKGNSLKGYRFF